MAERLPEMVAGTIGRRIVAGRYLPGDVLPTEPMIQEEFGVSRTAVREAIRLLSAKGLTTSRPKIGTRVRPTVDWNMLDPEVLRWQIDQNPTEQFIHHLFDMREIIEPAASARAAERATPEQIETLGIAMDGITRHERASPEQIQADIDFHMEILEATHNPMLRSVGALIQSALSLTFSLSWRTAMRDDGVIQHRAIYEAIARHDPDEAFLAMRRLLRSAKGDVVDAISASRREAREIR